jgi:hypothetical protein
MTDTKALLELAARCEAAAGADTEIDARIWHTVYGASNGWEYDGYPRKFFTASLDAAMTLVPKGIYPMIDCLQHDGGCEVELGYLTKESDNGFGGLLVTSAATPALALCAASLRAIAQEQSK